MFHYSYCDPKTERDKGRENREEEEEKHFNQLEVERLCEGNQEA